MTPQQTTADLHQRLLADLTVLARPRHARWDELDLMEVRSFLKEELSALGGLEEHHFQFASDAGVNLIHKLDSSLELKAAQKARKGVPALSQ